MSAENLASLALTIDSAKGHAIWPEVTDEITIDDHALDPGDVANGLGLTPSTDNARGEDYYDQDEDELDAFDDSDEDECWV